MMFFQTAEVSENSLDLPRRCYEPGHIGVAGGNPFSQRLG